ncbi:MAG: bifunctional hydroxymethylpyrimidine kinase/phosphomethylpyrimidine kinase [Candidatus Eremiobacteraeota bacterium]|nr:bifunctional hydroxymethylpyrimidine kinase/phosphomethylpyrimidine kinase [Candidatus Eremiobacteraeota bacterium]MBV8353908.1 bifunctional hydroxymethylpyrimidine kinase/phosphomethylpyrimidine kinase [Candidatus Eremiobacteraeota bacterium]
MNDEVRGYPLLGSIQNDVGLGFVGNQAVAATTNPLQVRLVSMTTGFASARGGVEGRLTFAPHIVDFRRGVSFVIRQEPQVLLIGFLSRLEFVQTVVEALNDYSGIVVLDPVIGDATRGLYVSEDTANAIRRDLVPRAQIITPNAFEALLILDRLHDQRMTEYKVLDGLLELGPQSVVVTSWNRDVGRRMLTNIFANAYNHTRINGPYHTAILGFGAGDVFAAAVAAFTILGAAPLSAATLATAFATLAVKGSTSYGHGTVDPAAVHDVFKPRGVYDQQVKALGYARRFGIETYAIKPAEGEGDRLRTASSPLTEAQKMSF